jgi:uncharacterized membrane protein YeaQ/YmgE (transglycosylase-associated protein family)
MDILRAVIAWSIFGLVAGAIARLLVPGRQALGCFGTIVLGVVGSLIGGFIGWALHGGQGDPLQASGWIATILCATILLAFSKRRGSL